jgi:hypothetical protein
MMKNKNYLVLVLSVLILFIPYGMYNFTILINGAKDTIDTIDYLARVALGSISLITTTVIMILLLLRGDLTITIFKIISGYAIILFTWLVIMLNLYYVL